MHAVAANILKEAHFLTRMLCYKCGGLKAVLFSFKSLLKKQILDVQASSPCANLICLSSHILCFLLLQIKGVVLKSCSWQNLKNTGSHLIQIFRSLGTYLDLSKSFKFPLFPFLVTLPLNILFCLPNIQYFP